MKKLFLLVAVATLTLGSMAQAGSWGFNLGNGAGFYYGNNNNQKCPPVYTQDVYVSPAPVYYSRPVTYYQPQTVYMQPYQQMRPSPVYYSQPTVIYSQQPVIYRETYSHCGNRNNVIYPNRW